MSGLRLRLVLKQVSSGRLVYTIPPAFRALFLGIAALILFALLYGPSPTLFTSRNTFALILCLVCIFASLYLERWIFDRDQDLFEQDSGLLFLHLSKRRRLEEIDRIVLASHRLAGGSGVKSNRWFARGFVMLSIADREGRVHKVDIGRPAQTVELRRTAERLAAFCAVPLEDRADEPEGHGGADGAGDP